MADIKLHLGCGNTIMSGWQNIDKYSTKPGVLKHDIRKLPYEDNSVSVIYSSHMIEHVHQKELPDAIQEWFRVLKPGGQLIVRCPHGPTYLQKWLNGDDEFRTGIGLNAVLGVQTNHDGVLNRGLFSESILTTALEKVGFKVEECRLTSIRAKGLYSLLQRGGIDPGAEVAGVDKADLYCKAVK